MSTVLRPQSSAISPPPGKPQLKVTSADSSSAKPHRGAQTKSRGKMLLLAMGLIGVTPIGWWYWRPDRVGVPTDLVYHTVRRSTLDVAVTERGNLESQINVQVLCEVDDVNSDGINGTPIVWVVENGASVKQGDLIVELDATPLQERLDAQILRVEESRSQFIQADVQYKNQVTQNVTAVKEAELAVNLADLAVKQFGDEEAGTFQINLQNIELQVQEAEAGQLIEQTNLQGVEQLYKLGYRSSGELAEARLNALRAQRQLASAISQRRELVEFEQLKQKMQLEGALTSARQALEQVRLDNEAKLAQAEAKLSAARQQSSKEDELLVRYRDQVAKCKIYAPQDGMVAYWTENGRNRREEIRAGAPVRPRQPILTLPNLTKMQVMTAVHESVLDQIKKGLSATVRVDAFPESHYQGTVATVAVLPDQGGWLSSDTKVYQTVVTIDEEVSLLKPGMTAVVEIHAASLPDVIAIPVQAIEQEESESWVYVNENGRPERRCVVLGMTNSKFVEVRSGLEVGEQVVLNPAAMSEGLDNNPSRDAERTTTEQAEPAAEVS